MPDSLPFPSFIFPFDLIDAFQEFGVKKTKLGGQLFELISIHFRKNLLCMPGFYGEGKRGRKCIITPVEKIANQI